MKFKRFIVFSGELSTVPKLGMCQVADSFSSEVNALRYIIENKLGHDNIWFQLYDSNCYEIILSEMHDHDVLEKLDDALIQDAKDNISDSKDEGIHLGKSSMHKEVDDSDFEYIPRVIGETIAMPFKDGKIVDGSTNEPHSFYSGVIKNIVNRNCKQLVTVLFNLKDHSLNIDPREKIDARLPERYIANLMHDESAPYFFREATEIELMEMI